MCTDKQKQLISLLFHGVANFTFSKKNDNDKKRNFFLNQKRPVCFKVHLKNLVYINRAFYLEIISVLFYFLINKFKFKI